MRAITFWQPWASLIAIGAKPFETRNYPPPAKLLGQRIAIHAAVRPCMRNLLDVREVVQMRGICEAMGWLPTVTEEMAAALPHGAVVCTAVLAGAYQCAWTQTNLNSGTPLRKPVVHISEHRGPYIGSTLGLDPFGNYSHGRWAWNLTDVQILPTPAPAKGKQGWWEFDLDEHDLTACCGCGRLLRPQDIAFRYAGGDPEMGACCAPTPEEAEAERAECRAIKGDHCDVRGDCGSAAICYPEAEHHG